MSTDTETVTPEQLAEAAALRGQAAKLLEQAEELDGKTPIILIADYRDGSPSLYVEFSEEDLMDDDVAREYLRDTYGAPDGYELVTFPVEINDLTGVAA
jgi:hypothetical protein